MTRRPGPNGDGPPDDLTTSSAAADVPTVTPPARPSSDPRSAPREPTTPDPGAPEPTTLEPTAADPTVSVVVVSYQAPDWLRRCTAAVLADAATSRHTVEIIIVDNASDEPTRAVLRELAEHPAVTGVQLTENIGFGRACNLAVTRSRGRLVLLLNPDAELCPGGLDALVACHDADPGRGIVGGRTLTEDGTLDPRSCWADMTTWSLLCFATGLSSLFRGHRLLDPEAMGDWQRDSRREVDIVTGCLLLASRRLWDELGGFDEDFFMYGEDADLSRRARAAGYRPTVTPDAVAVHAVGASSGSSLAKRRLLLRGRATLVRKHWRGPARALARALLALGVLLRGLARPGGDFATLWRERRSWLPGWPSRRPTGGRVLVIVQNMPFRFDRRVRHEAEALVAAGIGVTVVCPKDTADEPDLTILDDADDPGLGGVVVRSYPAPKQTAGVVSYLREFLGCWLQTARLSLAARREEGFAVIQACNPPDTYWLLALLWRPRGVRFVYDQHDLNPEVFVDRFGLDSAWKRLLHHGLLLLERATFATADHVIATNPAYAAVAHERGRRRPADVTVVMSSPDPAVVRRGEPVAGGREEFAHLVVYVGVMGPQDGVDRLLRAVRYLVDSGRTDTGFVLVGAGDSYDGLRAEATRLGIDPWVRFAGWLPHERIRAWLSTADLGVTPDPRTPFTDRSTMNKTLEYMACELPVVATDLTETRRCAGEAAVYGDTEAELAAAIDRLLDDPAARRRMAAVGRERICTELRWDRYATAYVAAIRGVLAIADNDRDKIRRTVPDTTYRAAASTPLVHGRPFGAPETRRRPSQSRPSR